MAKISRSPLPTCAQGHFVTTVQAACANVRDPVPPTNSDVIGGVGIGRGSFLQGDRCRLTSVIFLPSSNAASPTWAGDHEPVVTINDLVLKSSAIAFGSLQSNWARASTSLSISFGVPLSLTLQSAGGDHAD